MVPLLSVQEVNTVSIKYTGSVKLLTLHRSSVINVALTFFWVTLNCKFSNERDGDDGDEERANNLSIFTANPMANPINANNAIIMYHGQHHHHRSRGKEVDFFFFWIFSPVSVADDDDDDIFNKGFGIDTIGSVAGVEDR